MQQIPHLLGVLVKIGQLLLLLTEFILQLVVQVLELGDLDF